MIAPKKDPGRSITSIRGQSRGESAAEGDGPGRVIYMVNYSAGLAVVNLFQQTVSVAPKSIQSPVQLLRLSF